MPVESRADLTLAALTLRGKASRTRVLEGGVLGAQDFVAPRILEGALLFDRALVKRGPLEGLAPCHRIVVIVGGWLPTEYLVHDSLVEGALLLALAAV